MKRAQAVFESIKMSTIQNNIEAVLNDHQLIPVVTINNIEEADNIVQNLLSRGIKCIEVTLRTPIAFEAIAYIKANYSDQIKVGVGTIITNEQIVKAEEIGVDFIVSPGISQELSYALDKSGIPFIPGVCTPSEIMLGLNIGWKFFKFFPASLYGGTSALKTFGAVFPGVKFCPTGGIKESTAPDYLALENVLSVGGSWMVSK